LSTLKSDICGVFALSTLAIAGGRDYFKELQGTFRSACSEKAESWDLLA
jgi:hypothetical protein